MKILSVIISSLLLLLLPALTYTATTSEIANKITKLCTDSPVILLGEEHKQPQSQKLFLDLVRHYNQGGSNVFVGLEIPADQQDKLDAALSGGETDYSFLYPVIDHPAYRDMIRSLGEMQDITVKAIDARDDEDNRDLAMSRNIQSELSFRKYDKILVLVGNNHTIKNIKWHEDLSDQDKKYLAGYLIGDGVDVCSIQQEYDSGDGDSELIVKGDGRFSQLAMEGIKWVNHSDKMSADDVCDGVVKW
jgi:uncharacterized iron-regulated protein